MWKKLLTGATALLLAGCGGEKYPISASEASSMLAGLSYSPATSPMPVALKDVEVGFESLPGGNAVQWSFTKEGDDLGKIVATVTPSGDTDSKVAIDYVDGSAADKGSHAKIRAQLRGGVQQLLVEAIDSTLDRRQYDMALHDQVDTNITIAMMGSMMVSASDAMDKAVAKQKRRRQDSQGSGASVPSPSSASQPSTDLSRFSN